MKLPDEYSIYFKSNSKAHKSRELLYDALYCHTGRPGFKPAVCKEENGKPFFAEFPEIRFSITHSGDYWLCVFGSRRVGVDLQIHKTCRAEALSGRFFSPEERRFAESSGYLEFFTVWAAKESYLKYKGSGLSERLAGFSVVCSGKISGEHMGIDIKSLQFTPGYSLCICAEKIGRIRFTDIAAGRRQGKGMF